MMEEEEKSGRKRRGQNGVGEKEEKDKVLG